MICIEDICYGDLLKRPSNMCKTPYVADVMVGGESKLVHTPSLGCCGMIDVGTKCNMVLVRVGNQAKSSKQKCEYRLDFVETPDHTIVCVNPKMSESLVEVALVNNMFPDIFGLNNLQYKREVTIDGVGSRFDFGGIDESGVECVLEVKSVPLVLPDNISYFPDGYRKKKGVVVSPRALKHVQHLEQLVGEGYRCFLVFCVQRGDSEGFVLSDQDVTYREAVNKAQHSGVRVLVMYFNWVVCGNGVHCDLERVEELG